LDIIKKGFWMVLPCRELKKHKKLIQKLRISPMCIMPQQAQQLCIIVDYSFFHLNIETIKLAPWKAMQFGKALRRIHQATVDTILCMGQSTYSSSTPQMVFTESG
jgi:hypothetical protein